jgi:hypothetical protein
MDIDKTKDATAKAGQPRSGANHERHPGNDETTWVGWGAHALMLPYPEQVAVS